MCAPFPSRALSLGHIAIRLAGKGFPHVRYHTCRRASLERDGGNVGRVNDIPADSQDVGAGVFSVYNVSV